MNKILVLVSIFIVFMIISLLIIVNLLKEVKTLDTKLDQQKLQEYNCTIPTKDELCGGEK